MKREQVQSNARMAARVRRYHTWPTHQLETVGHHTFNTMRIYWQIWGPLPPEVSTAFIWHDLGEMGPGDLPFPVKRDNPDLKAVTDRLEADAVGKMGGGSVDKSQLGLAQLARMKLCDLVDMYEFGVVEKQMGNKYAQPIADDCFDAIWKLVEEKLPNDRSKVGAYLTNMMSRCV